MSAKARRSALGSVAMARARLHGFGARGAGGEDGNRTHSRCSARRARRQPHLSAARRGNFRISTLAAQLPGEGSAPLPAAPPGLARTERSARAWTPRRAALRILRVAGRRRALPAADPGPTGTAAAERGPRALAGNAGGRSRRATGVTSAGSRSSQRGLEGPPGGLTPFQGTFFFLKAVS